MSLLLLLRNHEDDGVTPPTPVEDDSGHFPGGELIWRAQGRAAPTKPNIPMFFNPKPIGKPKKVWPDDENDILSILEMLDDD